MKGGIRREGSQDQGRFLYPEVSMLAFFSNEYTCRGCFGKCLGITYELLAFILTVFEANRKRFVQ